MHELGLANNVLDTTLQFAEANGAQRVIGVTMAVGVLRDFEPDWFQKYFDHLAKDTIAEDAVLKFERIPITVCCSKCSTVFPITFEEMGGYACPECGCDTGSLASGGEMTIEDIRII